MTIQPQELEHLKNTARHIRVSTIQMLAEKSGHYGGCLSCVEILTVLYFGALKVDPLQPAWSERDRFVLSKGHAGAALYSTLAERGYFEKKQLSTFGKLDSPFGAHPDMRKVPGVDMSTGSLGHGLPVGVGMALASKLKRTNVRVIVLLGDGEVQEGTTWEAAMCSHHYGLHNLIAIVDRNQMQIDGPTANVTSMEPLADRWKSFGWHVKEVNGHSFHELLRALDELLHEDRGPSVIIANTIKGKGVSFMENRWDWHSRRATTEETRQALEELTQEEDA